MDRVKELKPLPFDLTILSDQAAYFWDPLWYASTGVPNLDFLLDTRDLVLGQNAAVSLKPAIQYAVTRIDRPETPFTVAGNAVTAEGLNRFGESLSAASKFFFRRGVSYKLTAGAFARVQGTLYTAHRVLGSILPAEEISFQPTNDKALASVFPLAGGRAFPTTGIDKAKLVIHVMGNLNGSLEWQLAVRIFNDPLARGDWTLGTWNALSSGNTPLNSGELGFNGLTITDAQWLELGIALRKSTDGSDNSRATIHVIPALKYL